MGGREKGRRRARRDRGDPTDAAGGRFSWFLAFSSKSKWEYKVVPGPTTPRRQFSRKPTSEETELEGINRVRPSIQRQHLADANLCWWK